MQGKSSQAANAIASAINAPNADSGVIIQALSQTVCTLAVPTCPCCCHLLPSRCHLLSLPDPCNWHQPVFIYSPCIVRVGNVNSCGVKVPRTCCRSDASDGVFLSVWSLQGVNNALSGAAPEAAPAAAGNSPSATPASSSPGMVRV